MPHARIKEKYNPTPTAREKAYHLWLMAEFECGCGCGGPSTVVHHPLTRHPEQRWRRDHEFVVPMSGVCHMALHRLGHEKAPPFAGMAKWAAWYRARGLEAGRL